ncbi:MAG: hypothetical protein ABI852_04260 [Gemmatimonadaceae bacterium]
MKHSRIFLAALALCASSVHAQNCLGHRALNNAPVSLSVNYRFVQNAHGPEARVLFGKPLLFGGLNVGFLSTEDNKRAFDVGAQAGSSLRAGSVLVVCPIVSVNRQTSLNEEGAFPGITETLLGGSIGMQKTVSPSVTLIPYAGVGYLRSTFKEAYNPASGVTTAQLTRTGAEIFGGVGVQFSRKFLARASIRHRDDYGDLSTMFTLGVTVAPTRKIRSK